MSIQVLNKRVAYKLWEGLPRFHQEKVVPFQTSKIQVAEDKTTLFIRFETHEHLMMFLTQADVPFGSDTFYFETREQLAEASEQSITSRTKSLWYPQKSHWGGVQHKYISDEIILPTYPIYIVSKGRYLTNKTSSALDRMQVPHYIVVEAHEEALYREHTNGNILVLPERYLDEYDTCDDLGRSKSTGPGAARNFCIDHSTQNGHKRHWVMDDNLINFHYLTDNEKLEVESGSIFKAVEDLVDRFTNVPVSGLNYSSFCKKGDAVPPFVANTRIYSCLLIENASGYRWRGRYNEDTDLSLRVLKDGLCTIQVNAFLAEKITTQRMRGGNSAEFYDDEGTIPKSKMLEDLHPDVARVAWKFGRWHHEVDYSPFKGNALIRVDPDKQYEPNEYGLRKVDIEPHIKKEL